MKIFITGQITDSKCEGCFSPIDLKEQLESIDGNEPLEVEITSEGGSVFAGIQIANMLSRHQGIVTTHAVGLCASIATVILMAGDNIAVDSNCFCMIHKPWSCVEGNANDMLRELDALNKCETAMMGYYTKHSKIDNEMLSKYLSDESWFLGSEFADIFDCTVVPCDEVLNIAAKCNLSKFKNLPKVFNMEKEEIKSEEIEKKEETTEKVEEVEVKEDATEQKSEEVVEEEKTEVVEEEKPTYEELEKKIQELEEELAKCKKAETDSIPKAECEKRVSGMQSKMSLQINDLKVQLTAKDEELIKAQSQITSLNSKLEDSAKNCEQLTSALTEKENALAMLNAGVNKMPTKSKPSGWNSLEGKEFFDYLKKNNGILTIKNK